MTFLDYILLTEEEKAQVVQFLGVYLTGRENRDDCILLYQMSGFYVELYYPKKGGGLRKVSPFKNTERLRPYLDQMDISEILKILAP